MSEFTDYRVKSLILSRNDGTVLTSVSFPSGIQECDDNHYSQSKSTLLSSFISALWILGEKSIGKFTELCLKGKERDQLIIVSKYDLLLSVILESVNQNYDYDYLRDDLLEFLKYFYRKSKLLRTKRLDQELRKELYKFSKRSKTNKLFWSNISEQMKIAELV
jgi:hypothetical protein